MKSLKESIAEAMDYTNRDTSIVPFLPCILQDFWTLGTPPDVVIALVRKHCIAETGSVILDLGCGMGAVSVKLAEALKCHCYGIDGIPEFIEKAKVKAIEYGVEALCRFEAGDVRDKIKALNRFDVIILGAIGPVFGNYHETMTTLSKHLTKDGIIIINDAYIDDTSAYRHPSILPHSELLMQTNEAGMKLIDEVTIGQDNSVEEFANIQKRCNELILRHPDKTALFENYIQSQADENDALENEMIGSIMVFKWN